MANPIQYTGSAPLTPAERLLTARQASIPEEPQEHKRDDDEFITPSLGLVDDPRVPKPYSNIGHFKPQINQKLSEQRKRLIYEALLSFPTALTDLINEYAEPVSKTLKLEKSILKSKSLYGLVLSGRKEKVMLFEWQTNHAKKLYGVAQAVIGNLSSKNWAVITEREPARVIEGRQPLQMMQWETSFVPSKKAILKVPHLALDHRRNYYITLPDLTDFYQFVYIHSRNPFVPEIVYDSRKPPSIPEEEERPFNPPFPPADQAQPLDPEFPIVEIPRDLANPE